MLQYRCISQPWTLMRFLVWKRGLLTVQSQGPIVRCTIDSDQGSSWEYENWVKVEAWHQGSGRLMVLASLTSLPPT